jgi:hypothetical protein
MTLAKKSQAPKNKTQTNPNDPNSKFQTKTTSTCCLDGIIAGRPGFMKRYDRNLEKVLVIEYWNLIFTCPVKSFFWGLVE